MCGTAPVALANYCHHCGAPLDDGIAAARARSRRTMLLVGCAAAVSIAGAALLAAMLSSDGANVSPTPVVRTTLAPQSAASVDLSTMTPREAADRLFNRVMSASESGDNEQALQFAPMAVAAYDRVSNPDPDVHYHLGLLYMVQGDLDGVRGQIALMNLQVPNHLLALVLAHDVAEREGDTAAATRTVATFATVYDRQMTTARAEYKAHSAPIERLRNAGGATISSQAAPSAMPAADDNAALFASRCGACHGPNAGGTDKGPPLVDRVYEPGHHADAAFYRAVRQGVRSHHWPFGDMPPVPGVTDAEIDRIVVYVRSLQRAAGIR